MPYNLNPHLPMPEPTPLQHLRTIRKSMTGIRMTEAISLMRIAFLGIMRRRHWTRTDFVLMMIHIDSDLFVDSYRIDTLDDLYPYLLTKIESRIKDRSNNPITRIYSDDHKSM